MDKTRLMSRLLLALVALFGAPAFAQTQNFEDLGKLDSLVALIVGADIGQPGGAAAPIDRRLKLKPCPSTPKVEGPLFGAAIVSCMETGWRLRVPLVGVPADRAPLVSMANGRSPATAPAAPQHDIVVKKGDPVELIAGNDAFSVSRLMIADEDGGIGDMIRVREDPKAQPVSARVERAGRVRAPTI